MASSLALCAQTITGVLPSNDTMDLQNNFLEFKQHMEDNGGYGVAVIGYDPIGAWVEDAEEKENLELLGWDDPNNWYIAGADFSVNILFQNQAPHTVYAGAAGVVYGVLIIEP